MPLQQPLGKLCTVLAKKNPKWPTEPNEQDLQHPITSLTFVIYKVNLGVLTVFTHVFRVKETNSDIYFTIVVILFKIRVVRRQQSSPGGSH